MRNANRTRNMQLLNWGFGIVASFITMMLISITQAQASHNATSAGQIPTADGVQASQIEPQLVTAISENQACGGEPWMVTMQVWNVGALGGDTYSQAIIKGQNCVNGVLQDGNDMIGTFSGGPNGVATFKLCTIKDDPNDCTTIEFQFEDGKRINYQGQLTHYVIQNPQAFDGWYTTTAAPTATEAVGDCTALISNIDNLTPGEVLSPVIDFVDESGKPTGIIGHALFINGVQTWSVIWDGKETRLEVQYTCLNHRGYSKQAVIPAFQGTASGDPGGAGGVPPQVPQAPPAGGDSGAPLQPGDGSAIQPGQAPPAALPGIPGGLPTAIGVLGMAVGLAGAAVSGGVMVVSVLNTALAKPPAAARVPAPRQPVPRVEKTTTRQQPTQKGKEQPGEKEKKEPKEKKPERKGLLQSEKEALKQYQDALDNLSGNVEKAIELSEKIRELSPEGREKLQKKLSDFKDSLDKVSKRAGNYADKIEMVQDMEEKLKSLGEKYKQIQKAHQEAFKDLQDVPEGAANQLADLTTAIETFGDVTDAALSRIPYFKQIYSDKTFEVTKSFREFSTGLRKTLAKTVFRTSIEGKKEFPPDELKLFSDGRENRRLDPEMQEWFRQQPKTQPNRVLQKIQDFIFGKEIPPEVKSMR